MDDSQDENGLTDEQAVSAKESNGVKDDHYCRNIKTHKEQA